MGARSAGRTLYTSSAGAGQERPIEWPASDAFDADPHRVNLDELTAELHHLAVDIDEVRRDLALCRHAGEPRFCDHGSPRFKAALEAHLQKLDLLQDLWHDHRTQIANTRHTQPSDDRSRLTALGKHINQLRRRLVRARAAHDAERHFCDPSG
jgi:hypothetical protein